MPEDRRSWLDSSLFELFSRPGVVRGIVIFFSFVLFFGEFGDESLASNDTGLHGGIARRMAERGPWLTPEQYGRPWYDHTPLFLWLTAASFRIFGFSAWAGRLPGLILGVATVIAVFELARSKTGVFGAFASAISLATTEIFWRHASRVRMDVPLVCFITVAVLCLALGRRRHHAYYLGFGFATGLAIFSKGPMGVVPLVALLAIAASDPPWRVGSSLRSPWLVGALVIIPLVPLPWVLYQVSLPQSSWFDHYFMGQTVSLPVRGVGRDKQDLLFVPAFLAKSYWPWLPIVVLAIVRLFRRASERREHLDVLAWAGFVLLTIAVSPRHPDYYLLPAYPALSVLVGYGASSWISSERRRAQIVGCILGIGVAGAVLFAVTPLSPRRSALERESRTYQKLAPMISPALKTADAKVGIYALHGDRATWSLNLYLDLLEPPSLLATPADLINFTTEPNTVVLMPAGSYAALDMFVRERLFVIGEVDSVLITKTQTSSVALGKD